MIGSGAAISQPQKLMHCAKPHRTAFPGIEAIELESSRAFPRHSHDQYGIGVLLSGAQRSWSGIGPVESVQGDVITVNPGEMHDGIPAGGSVRRWHMLYFDPPLMDRAMNSGLAGQAEFKSPRLRDPRLAGLVRCLFWQVTAAADPFAVEELLARMAAPLLDMPAGHLISPLAATSAAGKARARIDADPAFPVTLAELSDAAGLSRFQLVRAFARELGATPHAYLIQRRVQLARQLLLAGETPASAAQGSGFADQSHMTRAFVRQFGVTPGRYLAARR